MAFLQGFAGVLSSAQTATFKRVERLSLSSHVITNLPIFTHPGDTKFNQTHLRSIFVALGDNDASTPRDASAAFSW